MKKFLIAAFSFAIIILTIACNNDTPTPPRGGVITPPVSFVKEGDAEFVKNTLNMLPVGDESKYQDYDGIWYTCFSDSYKIKDDLSATDLLCLDTLDKLEYILKVLPITYNNTITSASNSLFVSLPDNFSYENTNTTVSNVVLSVVNEDVTLTYTSESDVTTNCNIICKIQDITDSDENIIFQLVANSFMDTTNFVITATDFVVCTSETELTINGNYSLKTTKTDEGYLKTAVFKAENDAYIVINGEDTSKTNVQFLLDFQDGMTICAEADPNDEVSSLKDLFMKSENLKVYLEELRLAIVIKPEDKDEEITIALGIKSDGSDAPVIALDEDGVRLNGFFYVSAKNNELQLAAKLTADETQNKYTLKKNAVGFISRGNEEELKRLVVPEGENIYNILYNTIN